MEMYLSTPRNSEKEDLVNDRFEYGLPNIRQWLKVSTSLKWRFATSGKTGEAQRLLPVTANNFKIEV